MISRLSKPIRSSPAKVLLGAALLLATLATSAPAVANPEGAAKPQAADSQAAAKAFEQARKLWDANNAAAALPLFRQAVGATGSPNARLFVARCLRETGMLAEAHQEMEQTVRDARSLAEQDDRYAATRDTAAAELAILEGRVGKLVVALGPSLSGASVRLGGVDLDAARIGKPVAVMPGEVSIVATKPSGERTEQRIVVPAGTTQTVTLSAVPSAVAATSPPAGAAVPASPPADASESFGVVRGIGVGTLALGAGGFVMFAIGTVQADDTFATLEAECGGRCRESKYEDTIASGKSSEVLAGIGLGVGIAGVTAGALMLILGEPSDSTRSAWAPRPDGFMLRF